jgi:hypothetical protein
VKSRRPRHKCVNNIMTDLVETVWGVWTGLAWLRTRTGGELL